MAVVLQLVVVVETRRLRLLALSVLLLSVLLLLLQDDIDQHVALSANACRAVVTSLLLRLD